MTTVDRKQLEQWLVALKEAAKCVQDEYLPENMGADWDEEIAQMQAAVAQPAVPQGRKQEPVAWGVDWGKAGDTPCVIIIKRKADGGIEVMAVEYAPYTHPQPNREWVGLTDEQVENIYQSHSGYGGDDFWSFARAIEAKLKEKNT